VEEWAVCTNTLSQRIFKALGAFIPQGLFHLGVEPG
jgi:hypothetical protein